ncbi:MAG: hypothetical protein K2Q22_12040 [Cytophagales bacterium]|nr:hypothetical protein [Cytophagales bacterium]
MNWKKYCLVSASIVVMVFGIIKLVQACGGGWDSEYSRIFFFLPENSNIAGSTWWLKQNEIYDFDNDSESIESETSPVLWADYEALYQEWNGLLGNTFTSSDIEKAIFNSHYEAGNNIVLDSLDKDDAGAQKAIQALNKQPDLLEYLMYAKSLEYVTVGIKYEDYEKTKEEIENDRKVYEGTLKNLLAELERVKTNTPLAAKYLFQLVKVHASGSNVAEAKKCLDQLAELKTSKTLDGWARLYYAGLLPGGKERNLELGKVLKDCPSKTGRCLELFHPTENTDYIQAVADSGTQACLWAMQAMHDFRPHGEYVDKIIQLDPNNLLLTDLINREINKFEDYAFTNALTGFVVFGDQKKNESFQSTFLQLNEWMTHPKIQGITHPYLKGFYTLAQAHLLALGNQPDKAISLLQTFQPSTKAHKIQKNITWLFILTQRPTYDEATLQGMSKLITEIATQGGKNENTKRCLSGALLQMQKHFERQGDLANAGLCFIRSNMGTVTNNYFNDHTWLELNATHADMEKIESLLLKPNKSDFETLIVGNLNPLTVYDSHARMNLREKNLDQAIAYFQRLPRWYVAKYFGFTIESSIFFRTPSRENAHWNIVEALVLLNQKVKTVEKITDPNQKATEYLAIASAFFELSNRGTYPYATAYYSTNYAPKSTIEIHAKYPTPLYNFYYAAEPAFAYFEKAKFLSTDPELKARITYHQLRAYDKVFESQQDDYSQLPKNDWVQYVKDFRNTQFYQYYPCPTIEYFVDKRGS